MNPQSDISISKLSLKARLNNFFEIKMFIKFNKLKPESLISFFFSKICSFISNVLGGGS